MKRILLFFIMSIVTISQIIGAEQVTVHLKDRTLTLEKNDAQKFGFVGRHVIYEDDEIDTYTYLPTYPETFEKLVQYIHRKATKETYLEALGDTDIAAMIAVAQEAQLSNEDDDVTMLILQAFKPERTQLFEKLFKEKSTPLNSDNATRALTLLTARLAKQHAESTPDLTEKDDQARRLTTPRKLVQKFLGIEKAAVLAENKLWPTIPLTIKDLAATNYPFKKANQCLDASYLDLTSTEGIETLRGGFFLRSIKLTHNLLPQIPTFDLKRFHYLSLVSLKGNPITSPPGTRIKEVRIPPRGKMHTVFSEERSPEALIQESELLAQIDDL